jgi:vacuolar-type H+-ATPase subunit H
MMNPQLESIVAADEDARARVESARAAAARNLAEAERERNDRREARARALRQAAEEEERQISVANDRAVTERQLARRRYFASTRPAAAAALPRAADMFVAIVRDGVMPSPSP